jgi:hypothetical protein
MSSADSTRIKDDTDTFWQKLVLPEEDRRRLFPDTPWRGGYRWFRSPNVVPIEKYRSHQTEEGRE